MGRESVPMMAIQVTNNRKEACMATIDVSKQSKVRERLKKLKFYLTPKH